MGFITMACALLLSAHPMKDNDRANRTAVCIHVGKAALDADLDPAVIISVAWYESALNPRAVSSAGAVGPLQVLPRYFCPRKRVKGCDLTQAGIRAFKAWKKRYPVLKDTLCHYNSGNVCNKKSRRYASLVIRLSKKLRRGVRVEKGH